jgi:hypothetical protein
MSSPFTAEFEDRAVNALLLVACSIWITPAAVAALADASTLYWAYGLGWGRWWAAVCGETRVSVAVGLKVGIRVAVSRGYCNSGVGRIPSASWEEKTQHPIRRKQKLHISAAIQGIFEDIPYVSLLENSHVRDKTMKIIKSFCYLLFLKIRRNGAETVFIFG